MNFIETKGKSENNVRMNLDLILSYKPYDKEDEESGKMKYFIYFYTSNDPNEIPVKWGFPSKKDRNKQLKDYDKVVDDKDIKKENNDLQHRIAFLQRKIDYAVINLDNPSKFGFFFKYKKAIKYVLENNLNLQ